MKIWNRVQNYLPSWFSTSSNSETGTRLESAPKSENTEISGKNNVALATESLKQMLSDTRVPDTVRELLSEEYQQLQNMLHKLERGHLHIAVFGRVSVGKSSVLNALIGKDLFSVSILHGETKTESIEPWKEIDADGVYFIDTPGINEIDGEAREQLAHEVANRSDLLLFVVDSDLTETERSALHTVADTQRPIILVVNKADQYNEDELLSLRSIIKQRVKGIIAPNNIVFTAALPAPQTVINVDVAGNESESVRQRPRDIIQLKSRVWEVIEADGKTLSALNASLFASNISEQLGEKILISRQALGQETIHLYCVGKGVAVALNPIPVADLLAAAAIDVSMVIHLSKIYGLPMSKSEAGELIKTIAAQMLLLYATFWAIHFASSALKIGTAGVSTVVTGLAQGAVAWYGTLVIGKVAEDYLAKGKSWGDSGPKLVVQNILDNLDRDSVMSDAKAEISSYLKAKKA